MPRRPRRKKRQPRWAAWPDERLLKLQLKDLKLPFRGTWLSECLRELHHEMAEKGLKIRPHGWLSSEWFSPSDTPGIAFPFYLAHPRLMRLERKMIIDVEGGTRADCMRILRHEAGHALDNAFRLHFKRRWIRTFGSFAQKYPPSYKPKPNSRRYVLNLDAWYAQAHPAEDFAETFAVWLQPRSNWRRRYRGWPALRKLEYVDELVGDIAGTRPRNRLRRKIETLPEIRITLREHYERRREKYAFEWPAYLDNDLRRIFSAEPRRRPRETAAAFLRRVAPEIQQLVSEGTGVHGYAIDHVLELMVARAGQLKLRVVGREEILKRHLMIMLTVQTMNVVHSGYYRIAL